MRLPAEVLTPQLGPLLEAVLLWSTDTKNKFKLKARGTSASFGLHPCMALRRPQSYGRLGRPMWASSRQRPLRAVQAARAALRFPFTQHTAA
jgi:hypothetical protein